MAFNIARWKSEAVAPGFHRPHSYTCRVTPPVGGAREIALRTETSALPGAAYMSVDNYRPYGSGKMYSIPYSYNPQEISVSHFVDASGDILQTFFDWANKVTDLVGDRKFGAYYHNEYIAETLTFELYDQEGSIIKTVELFEVFPLAIDQVQLSWGSANEITKINVQYKYAYYKVS